MNKKIEMKEFVNMKNVLITGGTTGIGFELARIFARNNYKVFIVSSNQERLKEAKCKLEKEFNNTIETIEQDLSKMNAATELYHKIKTRGVTIDVLVNNAGYGLVGAT